MYEADCLTIEAGTSGHVLMGRAGQAIASAIMERWSTCRVGVLCGPGNNGGDGFVVARLLTEAGWTVRLGLLGKRDALKGDAASMAELWMGTVAMIEDVLADDPDLIVDALFGAGLVRDVDPGLIAAMEGAGCPIVAVDVPSGVDGNTGAIRGASPTADLTVTFCRMKPGHLLYPGRGRCGDVVVVDIGIKNETVERLAPDVFRNCPDAWSTSWPRPDSGDHKYKRGHLLVAGGGIAMSGAARLAARAGLRVGAGLVTCAVPDSALLVYAAQQAAVMTAPAADTDAFTQLIRERRAAALVLGPGQGVHDRTREFVLTGLESGLPLVLDADALTVFADRPDELFARLHAFCLLTPHEGEFKRLFAWTGNRLDDVRSAAERCGATVLLKGPDTVIVAPDGTAMINDNAPADLATAGSGDVLAGFAGGLLAQGRSPFDAAAMAVWLHGETGRHCGVGLIAEDLPEAVPAVLRGLLSEDT
ncbi:MAG: NAD(P)H-hydrate dehydratase [Rhodospirillales bacterium]|nr:NAD(P)H-hydrate dehydratase [Rhodospirillales bacterium]